MIAIYIQNVLLSLMDFSESLNIEGFPAVVLIRLDLDESCQEVPQLLLNFTGVDVCAVKDLSGARWLIHVVHPLHPCGRPRCNRLYRSALYLLQVN